MVAVRLAEEDRIFLVTDGLKSESTKTNYRLAFNEFVRVIVKNNHYALVPDLSVMSELVEDEAKLMGDDKYKEYVKKREMDAKYNIKPEDEAKLISIMGDDKYKEFIKGLTKNLVKHRARLDWVSKEESFFLKRYKEEDDARREMILNTKLPDEMHKEMTLDERKALKITLDNLKKQHEIEKKERINENEKLASDHTIITEEG